MDLILGTRGVPILRNVVRKSLVLLSLLALAAPLAAVAAPLAGDGTVSVEDGRGKVTIEARGAVIGRLANGSVTIWDLTPEDAFEPVVYGDDYPVRLVGETGVRYSGIGMRFRVIGGRYRIAIVGRGIDLSAVGKGWASLKGEGFEPGVYSVDGADCSRDRASCKPLPELERRFALGTLAAEKTQIRLGTG
jgi:hypothetical protein